jgi:hypothetical protein
MKEIACPSCKYGVTEIVAIEVVGRRTNIMRRCSSCGAELATYKYDDGTIVAGNMTPPPPPPMVDLVGPMRDETGNLLFNPEL